MRDVISASNSETTDARPLWSVMIPSYNPTGYLRETLQSATESLAACSLPHEIQIVDDASPATDVAAMVKSWGFGSIPVHRRTTNGGLAACWNECIARSRGQLIHILHQDDLVKPAFHSALHSLSVSAPAAGMYFCRSEFLDGQRSWLDTLEQPSAGVIEGWLERICAGQRLQCPSVAVRRTCYEQLGGFDSSLRFVLDWEMWIRIAASFPVGYIPDALAIYRMHASAETRRIKAAGIATRDFAVALQRIRGTLEPIGRLDCLESARQFALNSSTWTAQDAEASKQRRAAMREVRAAIRYLSSSMGFHGLLRHLRWYLRLMLRLPSLRMISGYLRR